tara:strand:- start:444 stop:728 length:285 start_codon:yes stop_codon:yes gene_type:complete
MIVNLPVEIVVVITSYLDFKKEDLFYCRLVNKEYKKVMDDPISIKGYPDLINCSFFAFTKNYHELMEEKRQRELEVHNEFIDAYRLMLMDFGWL